MSPDPAGVLHPSEFAGRLRERLPELATLARIDIGSLMAKDSSDLTPADWRTIAFAIQDREADYDGFVVVHGTDTMAYSASAVAFLLPALSKPVVFTGSQRPLEEPRSDARINLVDAVTVAAMAIPEVAVCMNSVLLRGARCRKRSTTAYTAFESPNFPPLARLGVTIDRSPEILPPRRAPGDPVPPPYPLEAKVSVLFLTPATRVEEIEAHGRLGTRGLLLLAFGSGNVPVGRGVAEALRALDVPVVVLSQCFEGPVDLALYPGGRTLLEAGAIDGGDMTLEAGLTKLMVGLGRGLAGEALRRYIEESVAGERTSR